MVAVTTQVAALGWTYDGAGLRAPAPQPSPVPASVPMFQAREALRRTPGGDGGTLLDKVNAHVDAHRVDNPTLALAWEYATQVERYGAFVTTLAGVFGLDETALDNLFGLAATIDA